MGVREYVSYNLPGAVEKKHPLFEKLASAEGRDSIRGKRGSSRRSKELVSP